MKIKNPKTGEYLNIYSARLTFKKKENGQVSDKVRITIRYGIKRPTRQKDLEVPKEINTDNLNWKRYRGEDIAIYRRTGNSENYDYVIKSRISIPTALRYRLEDLVKEVCFEKITRYTK